MPDPTGKSPAQLEAEIAAQRERLAADVDALAARVDVKSHARAKVAEARDRATTATGRPRTGVLVAGASLVGVAVVLLVWRARR